MAEGEGAPKPDFRNGFSVRDLPDGGIRSYGAVPFFWSQHYDVAINYVGHAENWEAVEIEGQVNLNGRDCAVTYKRRGRTLAVATISPDLQSLQAEAAMESA